MIVGRRFIWLHLPKTAGHAVEAAIRCAIVAGDGCEFDPPDFEGWHDSIPARRARDPAFACDGKVVLAGFRRLPWWILSRVHYEASRPPFRVATREMLCKGQFFERDGDVFSADDYARGFVASRVNRWLRMEHLADDFLANFCDLFGERVRLGQRRLRRIINRTAVDYIKSVEFYFTGPELERLYEANPVWASIERSLYGDLLRLPEAGPALVRLRA